MRVPLEWLRQYCDPDLDVHGIEERLTMTGTKVEAVHHHGVSKLDRFVVGRVLTCERHPDADRLSVCTVDLGGHRPEGPATIVCGAPNVAAGQTVAVACPGAVMPDQTKLKKAKLRGIASEGMILAEDELQIGVDHAGIIVLDEPSGEDPPTPGTPLATVLPIATEVLELEITPNRPDCLGLYGVARELHAATGASLAGAPWQRDPLDGAPTVSDGADVRIVVQCPDLCPRFTARVFTDIVIGPSPRWLKARLMAAGQRPINNVVDVTNYAMLLTGQPLHAFDLDRIEGATLIVRRGHEEERVQTLDGQTRVVDPGIAVIEDAAGPTSIAGLMGGARSEVQGDTTRVLLEVACWDGPAIHRASWKLGLRSEASSRFEKGLAPEQCLNAQALATALMIECCAAKAIPQTIDVKAALPATPVIGLRASRVRRILGVDIPRPRQAEILRALGFQAVEVDADDATATDNTGADATEDPSATSGCDLRPEAGTLDVTVPPERRDDITREVDLIEEIARIDGLARLPATLPARRGAAGRLTHAQRVRRTAEDILVGRGLHEVVGWSFADPRLLDWLALGDDDPLRRVVTLENPLSEAQSMMRPTLMGSLLDAARHNVSRGASRLAIFESGTVYRAGPPGQMADEHHALGALLSGPLDARSWRAQTAGDADFFAAKALLGAILDRLHVQWTVTHQRWSFLHPGASAAVLAGERQLGFIGEIHPLVAARWDLPRTAAFAIDLGKLAPAVPEINRFRPFAAVPPVRRDLAVALPQSVAAAAVLQRVRAAGGSILDDVSVFDVYTGAQVGEGRRSLALALTFQAPDRTLTDEDVAPAHERILVALRDLGGELRG